MKEWKQASGLAMLELRHSKRVFLLAFLFFISLTFYFATSIHSYMHNGHAGFDLFFMLLFSVAAFWVKPKEFQSRKLNNDISASHLLVMLKQLPIKQNALIKSRIIFYFFYAFPFQVLLLMGMYLLSPDLRNLLSIGSFVAFSIIWLSFGVYIGYVFPASDTGDVANMFKIILYFMLIAGCLLFLLIFIQLIFDQGMFYWTIIAAKEWPILSSLISIVLAFSGAAYWKSYMKKRMRTLDYLREGGSS